MTLWSIFTHDGYSVIVRHNPETRSGHLSVMVPDGTYATQSCDSNQELADHWAEYDAATQAIAIRQAMNIVRLHRMYSKGE